MSSIWHRAAAWFWRCPLFHSNECLAGPWKGGGCSCGRLGRDTAISDISAVPYRTPACDRHLPNNDSDQCPWCELEQRAASIRHHEQMNHRLGQEIERLTAERADNERLRSDYEAADKVVIALEQQCNRLYHTLTGIAEMCENEKTNLEIVCELAAEKARECLQDKDHDTD